jgi:hypothetical protein
MDAALDLGRRRAKFEPYFAGTRVLLESSNAEA